MDIYVFLKIRGKNNCYDLEIRHNGEEFTFTDHGSVRPYGEVSNIKELIETLKLNIDFKNDFKCFEFCIYKSTNFNIEIPNIYFEHSGVMDKAKYEEYHQKLCKILLFLTTVSKTKPI